MRGARGKFGEHQVEMLRLAQVIDVRPDGDLWVSSRRALLLVNHMEDFALGIFQVTEELGVRGAGRDAGRLLPALQAGGAEIALVHFVRAAD